MSARSTLGDTAWFTHDRFGLFIHWGLYALGARHEWMMQKERWKAEDYERRYFPRFNPDLYDPEAWADAAAHAGMKYFVITTKHHEGFCLWDTKLTDYKAPNTPAGADLLRPMIDAFRRRGLKVGLYHSLLDWHHPDFLVDDFHPLRGEKNRAELNKGRDQKRYIAYLHGQVRELLTNYGPIDLLFFDFTYPSHPGRKNEHQEQFEGKGPADWDAPGLVKLVRELQPHIMLNDRLGLWGMKDDWDYKTPEQFVPKEGVTVNGTPVVWEACQTFSGSWGYHRDEQTWKSHEQLVQILIDGVSKDGSLLMNVGPTARGTFDTRALDALTAYGQWMALHERSIYGCGRAPAEFPVPQDCRLTYHPASKRLYVHIFNWPFERLHLDGFAGRVAYAQLLNDASEVRMTEPPPSAPMPDNSMTERQADGALTLHLPVRRPSVLVPVIELFLK